MSSSSQGYGTLFVRLIIAPVLSLFSGFHTMDFLLGGLYSWPQLSRVIAMTFAIIILSYEFVYKENSTSTPQQNGLMNHQGMKAILYSCFLPYMVGALALLSIVLTSQ